MNKLTTLQNFYSFSADDLVNTLPKGFYHLKVDETELGEWDDGRARLDFSTIVVSGAQAGRRGPKHQFTLGASSGVTQEGRAFEISEDDARKRMTKQVDAMMNGKPIYLAGDASAMSDSDVLEGVGQQIVNMEFIGNVRIDKNGYPRIGQVFSMSQPPKGFTTSEHQKAFDLNSI